jgi:indole-3-glycerol phosphate synthase
LIEELVAAARERARALPREETRARSKGIRFDEALRGKNRLGVIAEFKQASPSLGAIAERDVATQVRSYARAGARAVSVLTEPTRFHGNLEHLERATDAVDIPVLMKDFVVDLAQVLSAARLGAGAVLLIARCLSETELDELAMACCQYGLAPFVECHDRKEIERALAIEEAVVGINNRNLETMTIDRRIATELLRFVPKDRVVVAESGYERPEDTEEIRGLADAVLIGSALMKSDRPEAFIREVSR